MIRPHFSPSRIALAALLALAALAGCGDDDASPDADAGDVVDGTEGGADADADAGADADADAGPDVEEADIEVEAEADAEPDVPADPCGGDCFAGYRTACTCAVEDPCGWSDDDICDTRRCEREYGFSFDDGDDCATRENCAGDCRAGVFNACTCDPRDPCRWEPDGRCDYAECRAAVPDGPIFLDTEDCAGAACDGACRETIADACTCGADDPCHWAGDGFCDDTACEAIVPGAHFDDSADCGGTPGALTVAATSVVNELDRNDMYLMGAGLAGLGYDWVVRDADVTTAELRSYLERDLTTLYHTSHGNDGVVVTADGTLGVSDVTLGVRNAIFATCLTLVASWAPAFGPATETVLGYSDVSYDYIDDDVVRQMLARLGAGDGYMLAWYEANVAVDGLDDRWIGYVREGADIVEYSARSGVAPTPSPLPDGAAWVALVPGGRLWAASTLLADALPYDTAPRLLAEERDAGWRAGAAGGGGWSRLGPGAPGPAEAIAAARTFVEDSLGGLPPDAVLAGATPVFARREGRPGALAGWTVRWTRVFGGVPLRGNGMADHLAVLVGPSGAVAWSSWWPERSDAPASVAGAALLLDAAAALRAAAGEIAARVKGELRLRAARPVLGTAGPGRGPAVPAWEYDDGRGTTVVVDALTGRVLR